jgi:hypothetical protein
MSNDTNSSWVEEDAYSYFTQYDLDVINSLQGIAMSLILVVAFALLVDRFLPNVLSPRNLSKTSSTGGGGMTPKSSPPSPTAGSFFSGGRSCSWHYISFQLLHWFKHPTMQVLIRLEVSNVIFTLIYLACSIAWQYQVEDSAILGVGMCVTLFYALAKFCLSGFYIVRYQITAADLEITKVWVLMALWILNVGETLIMTLTAFNYPPYIAAISEDAALALLILFPIVDGILNCTLLYLLLSPVKEHDSNLKRMYKDKHIEKETDEGRRIRHLEGVIFKAAITCGISVTLTILCNIIYALSFYVYTDDVDEKGNHPFYNAYIVFYSLEAAFCCILPMANHPRFFKVFRCLSLRNGIDKAESKNSVQIKQAPMTDTNVQVTAVLSEAGEKDR